jgi:hypothetical protein
VLEHAQHASHSRAADGRPGCAVAPGADEQAGDLIGMLEVLVDVLPIIDQLPIYHSKSGASRPPLASCAAVGGADDAGRGAVQWICRRRRMGAATSEPRSSSRRTCSRGWRAWLRARLVRHSRPRSLCGAPYTHVWAGGAAEAALKQFITADVKLEFPFSLADFLTDRSAAIRDQLLRVRAEATLNIER